MTDIRASYLRRLANTARVAAMAWRERRVPFWSIERLERIQRRRLRSMVRHAYDTVPFYRQVMEERRLRPADFQTAEDLAALPLLDDLIVRRQVERFRSSLYKDHDVLMFQTSGAYSRARKQIYSEHASVLRRLATAERDRAVLNRLLGRGWGQVQLFLLPSASVSILLRRFWDGQVLTPRGLASRHELSSEEPFDQAVEKLNAVRPDVVFSYGSYADEFFRWMADRRIQAAMPKVWMYGGDTLSAAGRELVESFGCLVYSTYQSVETDRLGFQCERRDGFHLNMDLCAVRLVDETGRTVAPGQRGEVVISNFHNRAMVLLNYRLGDMGVLATGKCPCGRTLPVLARLEGKVNAILSLPDGRRIIAGSVELLFKDELKETLQAQLVQSAPRQVLWNIVPYSGADREALRRRVQAKTRSVLGDGMEVAVEFVQDIPRTPTGKFRPVVPLESHAGEQEQRA